MWISTAATAVVDAAAARQGEFALGRIELLIKLRIKVLIGLHIHNMPDGSTI